MNNLQFNGENYTLELTRGDTGLLEFRFVDDEGYPANLTDHDILLTVKEWTNDSDAESKLQLSPYAHEDADPENGIIFFKFKPADTKNLEYKKYSFDVQITKDEDIWTPIVAYLVIKKEIKF